MPWLAATGRHRRACTPIRRVRSGDAQAHVLGLAGDARLHKGGSALLVGAAENCWMIVLTAAASLTLLITACQGRCCDCCICPG